MMNQYALLALALSYLLCLPGLCVVVRCKLLRLIQGSLLVCVTCEARVGCHSGLFGNDL